MKKLAFAAALSLGATSAMAGGLAEPEPIMEPEVIVEESGGTSGDIVIPLLLLAIIGAVAASD